jgi:hypothetical protein
MTTKKKTKSSAPARRKPSEKKRQELVNLYNAKLAAIVHNVTFMIHPEDMCDSLMRVTCQVTSAHLATGALLQEEMLGTLALLYEQTAQIRKLMESPHE